MNFRLNSLKKFYLSEGTMVTVKCFAALREQVGFATREVICEAGDDAAAIWRKASDLPLDAHILVAINQQYAELGSAVTDGDEVAFFPPVTGG